MRTEPDRFPPQDDAYPPDDIDIENDSESAHEHEHLIGRHLRTDE